MKDESNPSNPLNLDPNDVRVLIEELPGHGSTADLVEFLCGKTSKDSQTICNELIVMLMHSENSITILAQQQLDRYNRRPYQIRKLIFKLLNAVATERLMVPVPLWVASKIVIMGIDGKPVL